MEILCICIEERSRGGTLAEDVMSRRQLDEPVQREKLISNYKFLVVAKIGVDAAENKRSEKCGFVYWY